MTSTLKEFHSFHSMVCQPNAAQRCIDEFKSQNGCILFMPTSYCSESTHSKNSKGVIANYDASLLLNLFSYYLLVLWSFTGLSTLLGMTDTVETKEYSQQGDLCVWPLQKRNPDVSLLARSSKMEPLIQIEDSIYKYMEYHVVQCMDDEEVSQNNLGDKEGPNFYLNRKFEYHFRLIGLHVIMVHFLSTYMERKTLHLVEVYHIRNPLLRFVFSTIMNTLGKLLRHLRALDTFNYYAKSKNE